MVVCQGFPQNTARESVVGKYHSSFQQTLWQLQITFGPDEYLELISKYMQPGMILWKDIEVDTYWNKLPRYLIARCPLCGVRLTNCADTHSLFEWGGSDSKNLSSHPENAIPCAHFVGVEQFIHLNGNFPTELGYFPCTYGDVPIAVPELLLDELHAGAVIHSLPICRVEGDAFTPRYSVYTVTYYADSPAQARDRSYRLHYPQGIGKDADTTPLFDTSGRSYREPLVADLRYWVERGKLHWLDLDDPTLPLKSGPASDFPYAGIQGIGRSYTYRKRPKPRWRWLDRNWHPDGVIYDRSETEVLMRPE